MCGEHDRVVDDMVHLGLAFSSPGFSDTKGNQNESL